MVEACRCEARDGREAIRIVLSSATVREERARVSIMRYSVRPGFQVGSWELEEEEAVLLGGEGVANPDTKVALGKLRDMVL